MNAFHVYPPGHECEALMVHRRKTCPLIETITRCVSDHRPHWGRKTLRVLEYGGPGRWTLDWKDGDLHADQEA